MAPKFTLMQSVWKTSSSISSALVTTEDVYLLYLYVDVNLKFQNIYFELYSI